MHVCFQFFLIVRSDVCCRSSDLCLEQIIKPKNSQGSNLLNHSLRVFWLASLLSIFRLAGQTSVFLRSCFTETPYKFTLNLMPTVNSNLKWMSHRSNRLNIFWVLVDSPVTHFLSSAKDSIKPYFSALAAPRTCSTLPPFSVSLSLCFLFPVPMCLCLCRPSSN